MKINLNGIALFLGIVLVSGCASPVKQIKDRTIPFERPSYSILPPQEEGWTYVDREQVGAFNLAFGKKFVSPTHSLAGLVAEIHSIVKFDTPEEFLYFVKKSKELDLDPRRFKIINNEMVLDNKFGNYSVRFNYTVQDYGASNIGKSEYLVLTGYGYFFVHPQFKSIVLDVSYSERGTESEIDPNLEKTAKIFINGLTLKNRK